MVAVLGNGHASSGHTPSVPAKEPAVPFVKPTAGRRKPPKTLHPNAIKFAEMSETILTQLRLRPCSTMEVAAATQAKGSTTVERLKKMKARGLVQRDAQGLYSAA
jgi:hypothetical protein